MIAAGTAAALTGAVIGGIRYHKGVQLKKALNEAECIIKDKIKNLKLDEFYTSRFDFSKTEDELSLLLKEAKKTKNLDKIKQLENEYITSFSMRQFDEHRLSLNNIIKNQDTPSSKALKKIVDEKGDFVEARKLYQQESKAIVVRDALYQSKANGKSIQETIDIFVKEKFLPQGVKPHTYDLSKELDLGVTNYGGSLGGGFRDFMVRKNKVNEAATIYSENAFNPYNIYPQGNQTTKKINGFVSSYIDKKNNTNVITLTLPDVDTPFKIGVGNKTGILTPLQQDLIEVGGRLNSKEINVFRRLADDCRNFDYDAFLSLIQHYKNNTAFMARAVK